jgi:hypothetical protein
MTDEPMQGVPDEPDDTTNDERKTPIPEDE